MGAPELFDRNVATGAPVGTLGGTTNTIPRWTGATTLGDSIIKQNSTPNQIALGAAGTARSWFVNRLAMEIGDSSSPVAAIVNPIGSGTLQLGMNWYNEPTGAAYQYLTSNFASRYEQTAGTHVFFRAASGTAGNTISWLESARIDSSGNVGIGTASPSAKLHTVGTLQTPSLGSNANAPLFVSGANTAFGLVAGVNQVDGRSWLQSQRVDGSATPYALTLNEAGGNVGIGTASPISPLQVKGNATNTDGILTLTPNSGGRNHQVQSLQASSLFRIYDQSAGASRLEIDINGNVKAATTAAVFDASTAGAGLKLPATPGNTDPNTLDAYADGGTANSGGVTWTPTLRFGGVDITTLGGTYGTRVGRYTRIGNTIVAHCYIALTAKGTATGAATIDGLPTSSNTSGLFAAGSIGYTVSITFTNQLLARVNANSTSIALTNAAAAGTLANVTDANFSNTSEIVITVSYPVT